MDVRLFNVVETRACPLFISGQSCCMVDLDLLETRLRWMQSSTVAVLMLLFPWKPHPETEHNSQTYKQDAATEGECALGGKAFD